MQKEVLKEVQRDANLVRMHHQENYHKSVKDLRRNGRRWIHKVRDRQAYSELEKRMSMQEE